MTKVWGVVGKTLKEIYRPDVNPEDFGYVNQFGLGRKVCSLSTRPLCIILIRVPAYFRLCEAEPGATPAGLYRCTPVPSHGPQHAYRGNCRFQINGRLS